MSRYLSGAVDSVSVVYPKFKNDGPVSRGIAVASHLWGCQRSKSVVEAQDKLVLEPDPEALFNSFLSSVVKSLLVPCSLRRLGVRACCAHVGDGQCNK